MTGVFYHSVIHAQNNKTRFFYVLYSDKTYVFDQSERARGPVYILKCSVSQPQTKFGQQACLTWVDIPYIL